MDPPRRSSRPRQGSNVSDTIDKIHERRAAVSQMMAENREGLGMKVIAVMVQRYGVLPKELWDLNSISDMGAERGVIYDAPLSTPKFKRITSNGRYRIVNLTIGRDVSKEVDLPDTLRRLTIMAREYDYLLHLPESLLELTFDELCNYNQPLGLPSSLRKLKLGGCYDLPVTLPLQLDELDVGMDYSQPLDLPQSLKRLSFVLDSDFDLPIILPPSLVSVQFGDGYNQPIILPSGIEAVRIGPGLTHALSLPKSLRKIEWCCNRPIQIPEGVSEVVFGYSFDRPVVLPASLKKVTFRNKNYSYTLNLPYGLEELIRFPVDHNDGLVLPEGLRKLTWSSGLSIGLPSGLRELVLRQEPRDAPLILPTGLVKISFDCWCQKHYNLPESVQVVTTWLGGSLSDRFFTHPTTLQHLIVTNSGDAEDLSCHKVHKLTVGVKRIRIKRWPQDLKELAFTVDTIEHHLRVPKGITIVGKRPKNVSMK